MRTVDPVKHEAKRRAILDAAAGCFAMKGFEKTTTAEICRAAGISTGSLFHYFPNKRAVFVGIFEQDADETTALLAAARELEDHWEAILHVMVHVSEQLLHPVAAKLVLEVAAQCARDAELARLIQGNDRFLRDGLLDLVERAIEAGRIDPGVEPKVAADWLTALIDAPLSRVILDPDLDPAAEIAVLKLILARFLRPVLPISPPEGAAVADTGEISPS
ncbi:TetR/AcrR family transcriptional regulator [Amycolatopsis regifaucium]|uniref:TetR family transcriptional regulator n=1 Tax=Amycolatopsis regifaucium TaxID=546365 RepID=A0A154MKZ6_9PSEU|nr:TetR/AcrR family transcriptional regulator [Amycolatopsis regifaucium]KZB84992.1 TetR family transcriptional regulator [Amycolatopsis regifaucium]OKA04011.1 TetR family transcriptional regulator [Amycolatopsis regifaucium]SFH98007.1 DNA-binding transcriptional regulator, AcrR family [Amycolatopsis regifaucium]